jgi:hypothetical protein
MSTQRTKADKRKIAAKWQQGVFSLESGDMPVPESASLPASISESVIFDKNQVRLVYKDIRTSLIATTIVTCLLAGAYAMMRF